MAYFIGIDIGTTSAKTILVNEEGIPVSVKSTEYSLETPQPGWAEQDPEDWWAAVVHNIKSMISNSNIDPFDVKGIGLSGQMHSSVFIDEKDRVIRPAILWCDQRTVKETGQIMRKVGKKLIIELTHNPPLTGFTLPKLIWLKNNEEDNYNRICRILLPKDYIRLRLTGEYATEVSDASGTLIFNVKKRKWSDEIIEVFGLNRDWLPDCFESTEISGSLSGSAASEIELKAGIPVVGGGGDQAAGAVGNGVIENGVLSATIGTSGVVFAHSDKSVMDPEGRLHSFCHAVPGKWHVMGVMLSAGGSFRWLRDTLCRDAVLEAQLHRSDPYEIMALIAKNIPIGSDGLVFLPYLTGERTPHPNPKARGAFIGLTSRHKKDHFIRSVMEGVTFGMNDSLNLIRNMKINIDQIRLSGGGSRSELWRQMQTDIYNYETAVTGMDEGPAFGAAVIAAVGTGHFSSIDEACRDWIKIEKKYTPDAENSVRYRDYYGIYSSLYKKLKITFSELSDI